MVCNTPTYNEYKYHKNKYLRLLVDDLGAVNILSCTNWILILIYDEATVVIDCWVLRSVSAAY